MGTAGAPIIRTIANVTDSARHPLKVEVFKSRYYVTVSVSVQT
jgi:hypothetical protein